MKKEQKNNTWKIVGIAAGAFVLCAAVVGIITGGGSEQTPTETERPKWAAWYQYDGETEQPDADVVIGVEDVDLMDNTAWFKGVSYKNIDSDVHGAKVTIGFYYDDVKIDDCTLYLNDLTTEKTAFDEWCIYDKGYLEETQWPTIKVDDVWYY